MTDIRGLSASLSKSDTAMGRGRLFMSAPPRRFFSLPRVPLDIPGGGGKVCASAEIRRH